VDYLRELARLSDRVTVEEIGRSYEERPLLSVVITSSANQGRIDQIQRAHIAAGDPGGPAATADAPVVVGLFYSVHGNETSSGEAALLTAYYLAAGRSPEVLDWLDKAVIVIDPAQNPDGRDRAANWHNAWKNQPAVSDPLDKEHVEAWPAGRTNHYFTDLNRDWLAGDATGDPRQAGGLPPLAAQHPDRLPRDGRGQHLLFRALARQHGKPSAAARQLRLERDAGPLSRAGAG